MLRFEHITSTYGLSRSGKAVLWCQCRTLDRYHRHTDHVNALLSLCDLTLSQLKLQLQGSVQGVIGCCPRTTADGFLDRALVQYTCLR